MALFGKLLRGIGWHKFRNIDGVYDKEILASPHKMEEIKFYLDFIKNRDSKKVHKILETIRFMDLSNRPRLMKLEVKKLEDPKLILKSKPKVPEVK